MTDLPYQYQTDCKAKCPRDVVSVLGRCQKANEEFFLPIAIPYDVRIDLVDNGFDNNSPVKRDEIDDNMVKYEYPFGEDFDDIKKMLKMLNEGRNRNYGKKQQSEIQRILDHDDDESVVGGLPMESETAWKHFGTHWWKFLFSMLMTIVLGLSVMLLLRYWPEILVWVVLSLFIVVLLFFTFCTWFRYSSTNEKKAKNALLGSGIFWSFVSLTIIIVVCCLFKRIRLLAQLYKEAMKAIADMKALIFVPIISVVVQVLGVFYLLGTTFVMLSAAEFEGYNSPFPMCRYYMTRVILFTIIFNVIIVFWFLRVVSSTFFMVISSSVSQWYFTRNKHFLGSPILTGFYNTFRFHMGSIFFGSFLITLVSVVKAFIRSLIRNRRLLILLECICCGLNTFLEYFSYNSYIETGIHGQSFYKSGKRASKLLLSNADSFIGINCLGSFVLGVAIILLLILFTGISYSLFMDLEQFALYPTEICFILNIIILVILFGVFGVVIDTLFICFCEDKVINDGISRPYYMSRGLMEFIESSKRLHEE